MLDARRTMHDSMTPVRVLVHPVGHARRTGFTDRRLQVRGPVRSDAYERNVNVASVY